MWFKAGGRLESSFKNNLMMGIQKTLPQGRCCVNTRTQNYENNNNDNNHKSDYYKYHSSAETTKCKQNTLCIASTIIITAVMT